MTVSEFFESIQNHRKLTIAVVFIAIFLDNVLLTAVVPIMPEYLYRRDHPNGTDFQSLATQLYSTHSDYYTPSGNSFLPVMDESIKVGLMLGSKSLAQLLVNPLVGKLTDRLGYSISMFTGFVILFLSTTFFAFGHGFAALIVARIVQGVGSSCIITAGLGVLTQLFPDDKKRGKIMIFTFVGLLLGVLVGPVFGGVLYKYCGKEVPFAILVALILFNAALQLLVLRPKLETNMQAAPPTVLLLKDPYILLAAGAIVFGNLGLAMLQASLPIWMIETMGSDSAVRGATFIPCGIATIVGTIIYGILPFLRSSKLQKFNLDSFERSHLRWIRTLVGLIVVGAAIIAIAWAPSVCWLLTPLGFLGFGIGMVDASVFPLMVNLAHTRYGSSYGGVYAIAEFAFVLAFALGPFITGPILANLGFQNLMYIAAALSIIYAPFVSFLKHPHGIDAREKVAEALIPPGPAELQNGTSTSRDQKDYDQLE